MNKDQIVIIGNGICPDLSELINDEVPMVLVKEERKNDGTDDSMGYDKTEIPHR